MNVGVHASHCCLRHGCKYGDGKKCPVKSGEVKQEYPCEFCAGDPGPVRAVDLTPDTKIEGMTVTHVGSGPQEGNVAVYVSFDGGRTGVLIVDEGTMVARTGDDEDW